MRNRFDDIQPWQRAIRRKGKEVVIPKGPSKPRIVVSEACAKKHRDPDEATARARATTRLAESDCDIEKLWPYPCKSCYGRHLTSRRQPKTAAVTRDNTYVKGK